MLEIVACEPRALYTLKSRFREKKINGFACACLFYGCNVGSCFRNKNVVMGRLPSENC